MQYTSSRGRHYCTLVITAVGLPHKDLVSSWITSQSLFYLLLLYQTDWSESQAHSPKLQSNLLALILMHPGLPQTQAEIQVESSHHLKQRYPLMMKRSPEKGVFSRVIFFSPFCSRFHFQENARAHQLVVAVAKAMSVAAAGGRQGAGHCLLVVTREQRWACIEETQRAKPFWAAARSPQHQTCFVSSHLCSIPCKNNRKRLGLCLHSPKLKINCRQV